MGEVGNGHATFFAAVHLLVADDAGRILFQRRQNSSSYNGWLGLPAGHVDAGEHPFEAMNREGLEELGIDAGFSPGDEIASATHRFNDGCVYFDAYYRAGGESFRYVENREPNKCSGFEWLSPEEIPTRRDVIPYEADAISRIFTGEHCFAQDLTDDYTAEPEI